MQTQPPDPHTHTARAWRTAFIVSSMAFAFLGYLAYISLSGKPPPPRSIFGEWVQDTLQPDGAGGERSRLNHAAWVRWGDWQVLRWRSRRQLGRHASTIAINQSDDPIAPFRIENEKPDFVRVHPALIVTCRRGETEISLAIDNRHKTVSWWPTLETSWNGETTAWEFTPNNAGAGIWRNPTPEVFLQTLESERDLTLNISPPGETAQSIRFITDGIEDVTEDMLRYCPQP